MKKNIIPSSFYFPTDISSNCRQAIIDNVTDTNINDVLLANAKSNEIFNSLINSIHLKDVAPLIISGNFSVQQLKELDATNKYMSIPDPKSIDFALLLLTGENKSLSNLMTKLDEVLKATDISGIDNLSILNYVFSKPNFTVQLKLTVDQWIKIIKNYFNAIEKCPENVFTDENVSALIEHFMKDSSSVRCQIVVEKSKTISCTDCKKILGKFTTDSTLAMIAVDKCNFTSYDQVKEVRDLCAEKSDFTDAFCTLFDRKEMWEPAWICEELQRSDAANYYHYSMPVLFHNVNKFNNDQWIALPSVSDDHKFGPFDKFTPEVFQKIAEKNPGLLVQILERLKGLINPESFLPLLKDNGSNADIFSPLEKLIFQDSAIYESILRGDFDSYKDILKSVLQRIKTFNYPFLSNNTLNLIKDKYDDEFYCDMVYCTKDLKYDAIPNDKLLSVIKKAPNEKTLEKFLFQFKSSDKLNKIFYNQTFDETNDAKFLELLKKTTSKVDLWTYEDICGKRIECLTGGNDPFFENFCPGKNDLITSNSSTYFSLIDKALEKFDVATVSKPLGYIHENNFVYSDVSSITYSIFKTENNDLANVALFSLREWIFLNDRDKLREWLRTCLSKVYNIYRDPYFKTNCLHLNPTLVALCTEFNKSVLTGLVESSPFNQKHYMEYCQLGSQCDNEIFTQLCPVLPEENVMQWLQRDMYDMIGKFLKSDHQHVETILSNVEVALGKTLLPENIKVNEDGDYVNETKDYNLYSKQYFIMGADQIDKKTPVERDIMIMSHLCVMSLGVKSMLKDYGETNEKICDKVFAKMKNDTSPALQKLLNGIEESFKNDVQNLKSYQWAKFAVKYGNDVFKSFCPIKQVEKYKSSFKTWYENVEDDEAMKLDHMTEVKEALGIK